MAIELPADLEERLRTEADRRGVSLSDYVQSALDALARFSPDLHDEPVVVEPGENEELEELVVMPLGQDEDALLALIDQWDAEDAARTGDPLPLPQIPRVRFRELNFG